MTIRGEVMKILKQVQDDDIEAGKPINNDCGWNNSPLLGLFTNTQICAWSLIAKKLRLALLLGKKKELLNDASCLGQSFTPKYISNENGCNQ
jgi:hypothetical protein